jgi:hypothetical protein
MSLGRGTQVPLTHGLCGSRSLAGTVSIRPACADGVRPAGLPHAERSAPQVNSLAHLQDGEPFDDELSYLGSLLARGPPSCHWNHLYFENGFTKRCIDKEK